MLGAEAKVITENTDLNSLTDIGLYQSLSGTVTSTLANKPSGLVYAFIMEVKPGGFQIIYGYLGATYIRQKESGTWKVWMKYTQTVV